MSNRGDLDVSGHRILNVSWTWGMDFPPERRSTDGWGSTMEVPAVLELLDLIATGKVEATAVREAIAEHADTLDRKYDPDYGDEAAQKFARCFGDCDICQAAEAGFRRMRAESEARAAKARDPEKYPYVIHGRTAHLSGCHHIDPNRWDAMELHQSDSFRQHLKGYAHGEGISIYGGEPVDWAGINRWAQANTGPQGGRYYRACKTCNPPIP